MNRQLCVGFAALAAIVGLQTMTAHQALAAEAGKTAAAEWASLAKLPDWSGVWVPDVEGENHTNLPPWKPEFDAQVKELHVLEKAGHPKGLFVNCLPEGMPSWMLVTHNPLEILYTPGRITMLGDSDGNRLRRVYTDGRPHQPDPDPSFHGDSIGHWEGDTLVVDTTAVLPEVYIATSEAIGIPNDGDLHVIEHIHLIAANELHDDLEIIAPHVLTEPWKTTRRFTRKSGALDISEGVCLQGTFTEGKDDKGNAAFVPVALDGGNVVPGGYGPAAHP